MGLSLAMNADRWLYPLNLIVAALLVSALGALAARLVRDHRPRLRHRILCAALVVLVACPWALWGSSSLDIGTVWLASDETSQAFTSSDSATGADTHDLQHTTQSDKDYDRYESRAANGSIATAGPSTHPFAAGRWLLRISLCMACVWVAGSITMACRWLFGAHLCHKLRHGSRLTDEPRVLTIAARACDAAQLDRRLPVAMSPLAPGPLCLGIRQPLIVLPTGAAESLADEELLCVLTHEAAHVARGDLAIAALQQLASCIYWWNPLLPTLHREINRAREQICDDYVVRAQGTGDTFAEVLLKLAEWCLDRPRRLRTAGAMLLQQADDLSLRVARLTEGEADMNMRLGRAELGMLVVLATAMLACAFVPALRADAPANRSRPSDASAGITPTALQTKKAAPARLSYNDNSAEGKKSIAGAAEFLSFTLPDEHATVAAVRIHGSRYGSPQPPKEDFEIYFMNQDLSEIIATKMAPYSRFKRGAESWVEIKFPKPIEVPEDFWVGVNFRAERTKGVYVSIDQSTDGSHSKAGLPGQAIRDANVGGDWMLEVVLAK
jgi:RNA polymerase sigma-70 factor (ECF subfamily)